MQMRVYNKVQEHWNHNSLLTSESDSLDRRNQDEQNDGGEGQWLGFNLRQFVVVGEAGEPRESHTHTRRTWKLQQKGPKQNPGPLRVPTPRNLSFGGDSKSTFTKGFQWFLMFFTDHSLKNEHTYFWVKPFSDGLGATRTGSCEEQPKSSLRVLSEEHILRWKPTWPSVEPHLHSRCAVHLLRHCRRCLVLFIMEMDPTIDFC